MQRAGNTIRTLLMCLIGAMISLPTIGASVEYAVHSSIDGLRADAVTTLGARVDNFKIAYSFYRLRGESAITENARIDGACAVASGVTVDVRRYCRVTDRRGKTIDRHGAAKLR